MLTAEEIHSVKAQDYDGSFWVTVEFRGKFFKCEVFSRCTNQTEQEMRDAGYVYVENGYEWGQELWIEASSIQ